MKTNTHPTYHKDAVIKCACGSELTIGSTQKNISVELCHVCHPFYTGKQKLIDTARRVEKFQAKVSKQADVAAGRKGKKVKKAEQAKAKAAKQSDK